MTKQAQELLGAGWLRSTARKVAARRRSSAARFCRQCCRPRLLSSRNMHTAGKGMASAPGQTKGCAKVKWGETGLGCRGCFGLSAFQPPWVGGQSHWVLLGPLQIPQL